MLDRPTLGTYRQSVQPANTEREGRIKLIAVLIAILSICACSSSAPPTSTPEVPAAVLTYFDSYFPKEGVEYYYYDQLGSAFSDQPKDPSLWDLPRFVEEVEQVRLALGLDSRNFYLVGHSWGGLLSIEYALKYQQNLKGLVISNMMASIPA